MAQSDKFTQLRKIISALEKFQAQNGKLLSLDKLTTYLNLSERELGDLLAVVFRLQALFSSTFNDFVLVKKWKNYKSYLVLKPKSEVNNIDSIEPKEIEITREQTEILSDIAYYFQHIKIGKGFNTKSNGSELAKKVKKLNRAHPHFFERRGNGLLYPSKVAIEAGNVINVYRKNKKTLSRLVIEEYMIQIV